MVEEGWWGEHRYADRDTTTKPAMAESFLVIRTTLINGLGVAANHCNRIKNAVGNLVHLIFSQDRIAKEGCRTVDACNAFIKKRVDGMV